MPSQATPTAPAMSHTASARPSSTAEDGLPRKTGKADPGAASAIASALGATATSTRHADDPMHHTHNTHTLAISSSRSPELVSAAGTTNALSVLMSADDPAHRSQNSSLQETPGAIITAGGTSYTAVAHSDGLVVIDGVTLSPGVSNQVSGVPVILGTSDLVIDGTTQAYSLQTTSQVHVQATLTFAGVAYTVLNQASHSAIKIGDNMYTYGQTGMTPGETIQIGDKALSVGSSSVLVNGTPLPLGPGRSTTASVAATILEGRPTTLTIGGVAVTVKQVPGHTKEFIIGNFTISLGGPAQTIDGQVVSMGTNKLVIDGSTTIELSKVDTSNPSSTSANLGQESSHGFYPEATPSTPTSGASLLWKKKTEWLPIFSCLALSVMCIL